MSVSIFFAIPKQNQVISQWPCQTPKNSHINVPNVEQILLGLELVQYQVFFSNTIYQPTVIDMKKSYIVLINLKLVPIFFDWYMLVVVLYQIQVTHINIVVL